MKCPKCNNKQIRVVNTSPKNGMIKRQRECTRGHQFITVEMTEADFNDIRDAVYEDFRGSIVKWLNRAKGV